MVNNIPLIVYPAKDLDKVKEFFNVFLGVEPYVDGKYYVGYKLDNLEVGLDPHGKEVISYIEVDDMKVSLQALKEAGAVVIKDSTDVAEGLLIAQVEIDGNVLGLRQQPK
jgi:predicted enzyme related to lactoylglutathione lyase